MSKILTFSGHSDDIFEAAGDEFYSPFAARVVAGKEALVVRAFYGDGEHNEGVWCIGIEPDGEDHPIPDWPIAFSLASNGYSAELKLTVPDGAAVEQIGRDEEG